jgi:hypothetical protein
LERRALNSEFDMYLRNIERAVELIAYFEKDLVYFKDSYSIVKKLVSFMI